MCGTMGQYDDVVSLPLDGKVRTIDRCIHHAVSALNAGGVETVACCCGHGKHPGRIDLADGRVLVIVTPVQATEIQTTYRHREAPQPEATKPPEKP